MCELEFGDIPDLCISDVAELQAGTATNVSEGVDMFCRQCTPDILRLLAPKGNRINSTSCFWCGLDCIGKYVLCFEVVEAFDQVHAKELRTIGYQTVFCDKCAEPVRDAIATMYIARGGTGAGL